ERRHVADLTRDVSDIHHRHIHRHHTGHGGLQSAQQHSAPIAQRPPIAVCIAHGQGGYPPPPPGPPTCPVTHRLAVGNVVQHHHPRTQRNHRLCPVGSAGVHTIEVDARAHQ